MNNLVRLLWGEDSLDLQQAVQDVPHIVMFLTLKLDSETSKDEVRGCLNKSEVKGNNWPQQLLRLVM